MLRYEPVRFPLPCIEAYLRALYAVISTGFELGGCITARQQRNGNFYKAETVTCSCYVRNVTTHSVLVFFFFFLQSIWFYYLTSVA